MKKKQAFTLAEVLITLGIIGVVAAMTIPTLIQNYQKKVWTTQLQKTVSMLENGFKLAMAEDEVMELENTKLIQSMGENGSSQDNDAFFNELKKYFKIIKIKESGFDEYGGYKSLSGKDLLGYGDGLSNGIYFADGSLLILGTYSHINKRNTEDCNNIKLLGGNVCEMFNSDYFDIDVNGDKGPNQFGRDRFRFELGNNGKLYPLGGKDFALFVDQIELSNSGSYWKSSHVNSSYKCDPKDKDAEGFYCAARIIENGWKMDY